MIDRYAVPEVSNIFSISQRNMVWATMEINTMVAVGSLSEDDRDVFIRHYSTVEDQIIKSAAEKEKTVHHDVLAFVEAFEEAFKEFGASKFIHYGLTSSDLVDTALAIQIEQANNLITKALQKLDAVLCDTAYENRGVLCIGRTHGKVAELTTWGLRFQNYQQQLESAGLLNPAPYVPGKAHGPIGNTALPTSSQLLDRPLPKGTIFRCSTESLLKGLRQPTQVCTQVLPRTMICHSMARLPIIAAILEKIATDIRLLSMLGEVSESQGAGQKGSSSMPHKVNPVASENICGVARLIRNYYNSLLESSALWLERDISHSIVERLALPDLFHLTVYALRRMAGVVENLVIHENNSEFPEEVYNNFLLNKLQLSQKYATRVEAYNAIKNGMERPSEADKAEVKEWVVAYSKANILK